jgi:hypothetical protein
VRLMYQLAILPKCVSSQLKSGTKIKFEWPEYILELWIWRWWIFFPRILWYFLTPIIFQTMQFTLGWSLEQACAML